jgi:carbon monoxide dehydrogenase subunit G
MKSTTKGDEGGRASTLTAHNELRLSPGSDGGTEVYYASDVSIFGRLGKFGLGIMKKKAKETGDQFAAAFRAKAEGQ